MPFHEFSRTGRQILPMFSSLQSSPRIALLPHIALLSHNVLFATKYALSDCAPKG